VTALLSCAACASGDYRSGPPPPPPTTTTTPEVTLRVAIGTFSASARVVTLVQPVAGFTTIVVPVDAQVVRAGGAPAAVGDLVPRAVVEVTGRPGSTAGAFVARRLVLL